ncbi:MAG: AIPR family protein [Anaerolineales bacterium]|uniref:AIPR family protein n=1 Tax=Candidatus Villigracilis proximus TaxID=3140683 RepID=UPI00313686CE|nr:AIPR family protein [Anaerolineales bacterium]
MRFKQITYSNKPGTLENPQCSLYYVTTGTWGNDQNNLAVIETAKADLVQTNLFSQISFSPMDANAIAKYYRDTKNSTSSTFTFNEKVTLPELPQISEAYYGLVPLSEFKKLLFDDKGNLLNIFDDNVRDFQGLNNPINKTIETTLIGDIPELFTVLNNGVTIVANDLKASGNKFTLIDYQIVNGCQTSNVLSQHTSKLELQDLRIPVRLIVTNNDEVKAELLLQRIAKQQLSVNNFKQ